MEKKDKINNEFKKDLEKIEKDLNEIEIVILTSKSSDFTKIKEKLEKNIKFLIGAKNYFQKQQGTNVEDIKNLIKKAKSLEALIREKNKYREENRKEITKKEIKEIKEKFVREEEVKLKKIMEMDLDKIERIRIIKTETKKIIEHIDYLNREINRLKIEKNEFHENITRKIRKLKRANEEVDKEVFTPLKEFDMKIKSIALEVTFQKSLLASYQNILAHLKQKDRKANYIHSEETKEKLAFENKNYYFIIYSLLDNDANYLFLKEIIKGNEKFINARCNNHPIIFEILDRYIENIKLELVNQKLVHENPNYFYALLKLFRNKFLYLTDDEEKHYQSRLEELKNYLEQKGYSKKTDLNKMIDKISSISLEKKKETKIDVKNDQEQLLFSAKTSITRVDLTKEHLEDVKEHIAKYEIEHEKETEERMSKDLSIPICDIRNSEIIIDTVALENQKYAISFGFSKKYETYLRFHLIDTTVLESESPSLKRMKEQEVETSKYVKKALRFKEGKTYPVITYQIKLKENGETENFNCFRSKIKMDRVVKNVEIMNYRNDAYIKNLIGKVLMLRQEYSIEKEEINTYHIEKIFDSVLSVELKKYFEKNGLPAIYLTELEMSEKDKVNLHYEICHFLSRIPKKEALEIFKKLENLNVARFYSMNPILESKIEIDTRNYAGYLNTLQLICNIQGLTSIRNEAYEEAQKNLIDSLDQEDLYLDYFTNRSLIRDEKGTDVFVKKEIQKLQRKKEREEERNRTYLPRS